MDIALLLGLLALLLALSVPIGIALGLSTAVTLALTSPIPLTMMAQTCFTGLDSFPLLAIPFFMLAGSLMGYGGISKRLVNFAESLVSFMIGGLAMVTVVSCMFFAAISGSGPATVSAIGSFMIPSMKEKKYPGPFAAALAAAAGSIGVIIPPSIPFVIYCVIAGASVGELFIAGIVPGILIGLSLMAVSYYTARKEGFPKSEIPFSAGHVWKSFKEAIWALLVPVIILGGIYGGIFTPTEAAVVGAVYALFVGKFIYKELDFKTTKAAFMDTLIINGATSFILGLSISFATFLTMQQIPMKVGNWIVSVSSSPVVILLLVNAMLLVVGCFVDNISSMIVLTPIFLPVMTKIGVDPIHFGLFMTVALAIGFVTPPYGANLFVASAVSGEKMSEISKRAVPLIVVMILDLVLLTFIPDLSLGLVKALMR
jgi:C4-dicarboxylate transporter DctM subunit